MSKVVEEYREDSSDVKAVSKFLSLVLRHKPESIGLKLDAQGWAPVDELLVALVGVGKPVTREVLEAIVAFNDKKRFSFNEDGTKIRANQGHSIGVNLALAPAEPPCRLYHGTGCKSVDAILAHGIKKMGRDHVHLSNNMETAVHVGRRHGPPVVLVVDAKKHWEDGAVYYQSQNGVWLTDFVPKNYIVESRWK